MATNNPVYKVNTISCANCGTKKDLILLPATSDGKMFGLLFSCPKCFGLLRRAIISIVLNDKRESKEPKQ